MVDIYIRSQRLGSILKFQMRSFSLSGIAGVLVVVGLASVHGDSPIWNLDGEPGAMLFPFSFSEGQTVTNLCEENDEVIELDEITGQASLEYCLTV